MQKLMPCLWFDSQAEEAANYYVSLFGNSEFGQIARYGKAASEASDLPEGSVMTVTFKLDGQEFMALNGGPHFTFTPGTSFFVHCKTKEELDGFWRKLSDGGSVLMPLDKYPFSERYGWVQDRFGVSWQLILNDSKDRFVPCLLFVKEQYGVAEEAMNFYMSQFAKSKPVAVNRYGAEGPGAEGSVAYAKFTLAGQEFVVMDGPGDHDFSFSPAVSFIVNCDTQDEVDVFWESLSKGGEQGQCGWLQDRYGVSWQIVPKVLGELVANGTSDQSEQVMSALITMKKLDIARLKDAFEQVRAGS
jgi:predicted 3-demethylubiquinone-9 3-methyltransferase (glyoxalase superfamily)